MIKISGNANFKSKNNNDIDTMIFNSNKDTMLDWFQKGYVEVRNVGSNTSNDTKGVVALRKLRYQKRSDFSENYIGPFVGKIKGKEISDKKVLEGDPESLRYVVQIGDKYIDLSSSNFGRINHAPNTSSVCNLVAIDDCLYQTKTIRQGHEIFFDYSKTYWVYQITGRDIDEWKTKYPESMKIWEKMHSLVLDYGPFLKIQRYVDLDDKYDADKMLEQVKKLLREI
jgi:hypothetical protein